MSELGDYLKRLRGSMSLREASKRTGISFSYIGYLEAGRHPKTGLPIKPSPEMLKGISKGYNHSYKDLMVMAGYSYDENENRIEETQLDKDRKYALELFNKITDPDKKKAAFEVLKGLAGEK